MGGRDANAVLVDILGAALRTGGDAMTTVPGLLEELLTDGCWRDFTTEMGKPVHHIRFADFVVKPPLEGLGADVAVLRRVVAADVRIADMLDEALKGKQGARTDLVNNVNEDPRPVGNRRDTALRRLRKDEPALHEQVLAGELSPHAAMVKAGHRPATLTVRADSPESIAATLRRRLSPQQVAEVALRLTQP